MLDINQPPPFISHYSFPAPYHGLTYSNPGGFHGLFTNTFSHYIQTGLAIVVRCF